jgi:hypothetical protein
MKIPTDFGTNQTISKVCRLIPSLYGVKAIFSSLI